MDEYLIEDEEFLERRDRMQRELIERLLGQLERRYLTREKMYAKVLTSRRANYSLTDSINRIDVIDAVRENVKTSLTFGNYCRAAWYLTLLDRLCRKYFR